MVGLWTINNSSRSFGIFDDELAESQRCDLHGRLVGIEACNLRLAHNHYQDP